MKKLKVMTVVGTRPEIIRLSQVITRLLESESIDHALVHTGQNYDFELNQVFFEEFGIPEPDFYLNAAKGSAIATIANCIANIEPVLTKFKPDAFLVLGDTNSCLCALAAKKLRVPVFHMEAGNRCFDMRVPEELNRRIVDHLADINLTYSSISRDYLLREGLPPQNVVKVGSPMLEVINAHRHAIESSDIHTRLGLVADDYFLVSAHREENIEPPDQFGRFVHCLNSLAEDFGKAIIVSVHPRTRKRIESEDIRFDDRVRLEKPMGYADYLALQQSAFAVLSDSGTISEEASLLQLRALNIREAHERPEAMEEAAAPMVGLNYERILQALHMLRERDAGSLPRVADYDVPNVSEKVIRIIVSHVDNVRTKTYLQPI
ncbi:MAG: UDP-N-acetylglucosamine 2-epimerase (non-hydrolyzing) [Pseudomonadota bacterium]